MSKRLVGTLPSLQELIDQSKQEIMEQRAIEFSEETDFDVRAEAVCKAYADTVDTPITGIIQEFGVALGIEFHLTKDYAANWTARNWHGITRNWFHLSVSFGCNEACQVIGSEVFFRFDIRQLERLGVSLAQPTVARNPKTDKELDIDQATAEKINVQAVAELGTMLAYRIQQLDPDLWLSFSVKCPQMNRAEFNELSQRVGLEPLPEAYAVLDAEEGETPGFSALIKGQSGQVPEL